MVDTQCGELWYETYLGSDKKGFSVPGEGELACAHMVLYS
jgi:hypothetical protein